jgi:hypothetical protein
VQHSDIRAVADLVGIALSVGLIRATCRLECGIHSAT